MGEAPRIAQQAESRPGVWSPRRPRPGPASFIIPPGPMSALLGPGTRGAAPLPPSPHPPTPRPVLAGVRGGWGGPGEDTWPGSCGDVGRAHDSGPAGHLVASLRLQAWGLRSPGAWGGPQRHRGNVDEALPSGDSVRPRGRCADGPRAPRREDGEPLVGGSGLLRPAATCAPRSCTPAPSAGGGETPSQRQQTRRRGA